MNYWHLRSQLRYFQCLGLVLCLAEHIECSFSRYLISSITRLAITMGEVTFTLSSAFHLLILLPISMADRIWAALHFPTPLISVSCSKLTFVKKGRPLSSMFRIVWARSMAVFSPYPVLIMIANNSALDKDQHHSYIVSLRSFTYGQLDGISPLNIQVNVHNFTFFILNSY